MITTTKIALAPFYMVCECGGLLQHSKPQVGHAATVQCGTCDRRYTFTLPTVEATVEPVTAPAVEGLLTR